MKILLVSVVAVCCAACLQESAGVERLAAFSPEQILASMPMNSDSRCVGISLVAAALLEGESIADGACDGPRELGNQIYEAAISKKRVRFREIICLDQGRGATQSREALNALATAVTDRYKARYQEMIATDAGRKRLRTAEQTVVRTEAEFDALLEADRDKILAIPLVGSRRFPSGMIKDTNHVVLIAKKRNGEKVIYDPNDPGRALDCELSETEDGLEIGWTCKYRDTGLVTTQYYLVLQPDKVFPLMLSAS